MVKRQLSMNWFKILLVEDLLPNPNTLLSLRHRPDPDQGLLGITLNDPMLMGDPYKMHWYRTITVNMCQIESEHVSNSRLSDAFLAHWKVHWV